MVTKKYASQKGSLTSLGIAIVVAVTLLFGSVYYLRQRGENIRQEQALEQYEKNKKAEKSDSGSNESKTIVTGTIATPTQVENSVDLPTTGPESIAVKSLGLFIFVVILTAYIGSRREVSHYL